MKHFKTIFVVFLLSIVCTPDPKLLQPHYDSLCLHLIVKADGNLREGFLISVKATAFKAS